MTTQAATQDRAPEATTAQYSLAKILGIWAAAALPMAILGWIVAPALAPDLASDPIGAAVTINEHFTANMARHRASGPDDGRQSNRFTSRFLVR